MLHRDNRIVKKSEKRKCEIFSYKKTIKILQKVSDQRKNKKTSCKIQRSTARLHNLRES